MFNWKWYLITLVIVILAIGWPIILNYIYAKSSKINTSLVVDEREVNNDECNFSFLYFYN